MAKNENSNFSYMTRRIGGTTYKVKVVFSDTEKETMEDKILRMIRNETVITGGTCGIINTEEAGTLVFSGVPAFFVTIVLLVQCSTAYNVHHFEPLFHQFHGGFQFVQSLMIIDPVSRVFGHMAH